MEVFGKVKFHTATRSDPLYLKRLTGETLRLMRSDGNAGIPAFVSESPIFLK